MNWRSFLLASLVALTAGCASPRSLVDSFEVLTNETKRDGILKVPQSLIASINGMLPHADTGLSFYRKHSRTAATAIGISSDQSFRVVSVIPGTTDAVCDAKKKEDSTATVIAVRKSILKTRKAAIKAIGARMKVLEARANPASTVEQLADLSDKANTADEEFTEQLNKAVGAVKNSGVIVARWDSSQRSSAQGSADSLLSLGIEKGQRLSGFVILDGLRHSTLFIGPDIWRYDPPVNDDWQLFELRFPYVFSLWRTPFIGRYVKKDVGLVTHLVQTKALAYLQDVNLEQSLRASLEGSPEDLKRLDRAILEAEKIKIAALLNRVESLSNIGLIEGIKRSVEPIFWDDHWSREPAKNLAIGDGPEHASTLLVNQSLRSSLEEHAKKEKTVLSAVAAWKRENSNQKATCNPVGSGWQTVFAVETGLSGVRNIFEIPYKDDFKMWGGKILESLFDTQFPRGWLKTPPWWKHGRVISDPTDAEKEAA